MHKFTLWKYLEETAFMACFSQYDAEMFDISNSEFELTSYHVSPSLITPVPWCQNTTQFSISL